MAQPRTSTLTASTVHRSPRLVASRARASWPEEPTRLCTIQREPWPKTTGHSQVTTLISALVLSLQIPLAQALHDGAFFLVQHQREETH
jgi:hypothetical protein